MRIERVVLEHHGDVAFPGRQACDLAFTQPDLARSWRLQPCQHTQRGGLAATARTDQDQQFPIWHVQCEILHGDHLAEVFRQPTERNGCHVSLSRCSLDARGHEGVHHLALEQEEDRQRRQAGQRDAGHQPAEIVVVRLQKFADADLYGA